MTEEQVTKAILKWLTEVGWRILDYDFPGGGTGRKFHIDTESSEKAKGLVIPDIIAIKDDIMLILENKSIDTHSDYNKVKRLAESFDLKIQLASAYSGIVVKRIIWGIGFSGQPKYISQAEASNLDVVINVCGSCAETATCHIVYGHL